MAIMMGMDVIRTVSLVVLFFVMAPQPIYAGDPLSISVLYLEEKISRPPVLSRLVTSPDDEGLQGARLGVDDNNSTGKFLNQKYQLQTLIVPEGESLDEPFRNALSGSATLVIANVTSDTLLRISALPEAKDVLFFNAREPDDDLRSIDCKSNTLHTMSSRSMLSDALMQFYSLRKWRDIFLIEGTHSGDSEYANAFRRSAKKFGLKIKHDKKWLANADIRRTAAQEIPLFTQARKYDALVVADEQRDFAPYLLYNTWLPRPMGGSAGLKPVVWSPVVEQWGAVQLQSRFSKLANRGMTGVDYANWVAVRSIGEAVTRTNSTDAKVIRSYLLSDKFELAGFKGAALSYRGWNGQLRQPITLVHPEAVVTTAPVAGFLHQYDELDTLGLDRTETQCKEF